MKIRDIAIFAGAAAVLAAAVLFVDIKTPEEYYALHPAAVTEDGEFVTIRVDCSAAVGRAEGLPEDGTMLDGKYALTEGESVYDVTARVLRYEGIDFGTKGGRAVYISGIGGLEEFELGAESGWIYTVNGTAPGINCGEYQPECGDEIEFVYVDKFFGEAGR
ncbi:DUF4430 domain-containing protein [Ruminococcus albus]|uniref:Transcobalamin-like C-terminal domain-containing protein n=1 Tax=Ruminococcus albus TaxID=1264 RepID=A0A1H7JTZ6_RUMAL|nr:DUF4430 domain-containing protein [Ruminococcus albus]SEK76975.1 protein of unknown function [Ruminococcus albus]